MVSIALAVQCAASSPREWSEGREGAGKVLPSPYISEWTVCVHWDGSRPSAGLIDLMMGLLLLLMVVLGAVGEEEGGLAHLQWTPVADRSV